MRIHIMCLAALLSVSPFVYSSQELLSITDETALLSEMSPETQRLILPFLIQELFIGSDSHKKEVAHVRMLGTNPTLCPEESDYLKKRNVICNEQVSKILGRSVALEHTPRIAFLGSGGGMRAALFSAGNLDTYAKNGIDQTFSYVGGVSGSAWLIFPWMVSGQQFGDFYPTFISRVLQGLIPKDFSQGTTNFLCFTEAITDILVRSFAFLDVPSSVDVFGLFLGLAYLGDGTKTSYLKTNLSSIVPFIKEGQLPMPLCTAVIPSTKDVLLLDNIECTPFTVVDWSSASEVPAWACGRTFKEGVSKNSHPPLTIGLLMGTCGSAYTAITLKTLWPMILPYLWPQALFAPLTDLFNETIIGNLRVFPEHVRNFSYGIPGAVNQTNLFNLWVDAGISTNIPVVPFFKQPERAIDIYVIADAGGDVGASLCLGESETYARQFNCRFPHCNTAIASTSNYSVFDDGPQGNAPIVIYIPMLKNAGYSTTFDPQDMMYNNRPGNFLGTDNFEFTQDQINLFCGLSAYSSEEALPAIINAIKTVVERKEQGLLPPTV